MPDLNTSAITAWLREHEPAIADDFPIVPVEEAPSVQPLLPQLGEALDEPWRETRSRYPRASRKIRCATRCARCWRRWAPRGACACWRGSRSPGCPPAHGSQHAPGSGRQRVRTGAPGQPSQPLSSSPSGPDVRARADRAGDGGVPEKAMRRTLLASAWPCRLCMRPIAARTSNSGCATLEQAAADGMAARIKADDQNIQAPQSVTKLTCLSNFFNGTGLDVISNLLDPTNLLSAVEGRICASRNMPGTTRSAPFSAG